MAKEISREFRPEFKDFAVVIEDDHGIQRPIYICIGRDRCATCGQATGTPGVVDVDGAVRKHIAFLEAEAREHEKVLSAAGMAHIAEAMRARRMEHNGTLTDAAALNPAPSNGAAECVPCEKNSGE